MKSITISGPFTRVKCAPISVDVAVAIRSGEIKLFDLDEMMENSEAFFSIYGADYETVEVELDAVFHYTRKSKDWYREGRELEAAPSEMFLEGENIDLACLDDSTPWAILVENYSGEEERRFKGEFDREHLDIVRVNMRFEKKILSDLIQVNYEDCEIVDNTEGEFGSLWLIENGEIFKADY